MKRTIVIAMFALGLSVVAHAEMVENAAGTVGMQEGENSATSHDSDRLVRARTVMDDYLRWAIDNSDAILAAKVRSRVFDLAAKNDPRIDVIVKHAEKKAPPELLLGMLGILPHRAEKQRDYAQNSCRRLVCVHGICEEQEFQMPGVCGRIE